MNDAVWRDVHLGRVWRAQACRIVEETPELLALWMPRTAPAKLPIDGSGARKQTKSCRPGSIAAARAIAATSSGSLIHHTYFFEKALYFRAIW